MLLSIWLQGVSDYYFRFFLDDRSSGRVDNAEYLYGRDQTVGKVQRPGDKKVTEIESDGYEPSPSGGMTGPSKASSAGIASTATKPNIAQRHARFDVTPTFKFTSPAPVAEEASESVIETAPHCKRSFCVGNGQRVLVFRVPVVRVIFVEETQRPVMVPGPSYLSALKPDFIEGHDARFSDQSRNGDGGSESTCVPEPTWAHSQARWWSSVMSPLSKSELSDLNLGL
ncbi:hypothetical protein DFJ77DRAFT_443335 [Powellomyces hirtus]|nr:hypothetical protein DFJ77DRAFT_443335 [Powellomyces hirtus]